MIQLRRDAAYIRAETPLTDAHAVTLTEFDEQVCNVLTTAHTVTSAARALAKATPPAAGRAADDVEADLESRVAESMIRLLQAERIELSPDS